MYFENMREGLDDLGIFVTVHLYDVDERHFGFGSRAEWCKDNGYPLQPQRSIQDPSV